MRSKYVALAVVLLCGCGAEVSPRGDAGRVASDASVTDAGAAGADSSAGDDASAPIDAGPTLAPRDCVFRSLDFGSAMRELDVGPGSTERLRFTVDAIPDPSAIVSATLVFRSFDADHPGEEGSIDVNGRASYPIPADLAFDNAETMSRVTLDVSALVSGTNAVEFGPGPLARSFFRIGDVALELSARVESCEMTPPPPPPDAVTRRLHFHQATFTNRATWVVPCEPGRAGFSALRDYAFTASGDEHVPTDCDGLYRAGGNRRGTATFTFDAVVAATYDVIIRARHTENRNPSGALFVIGGDGRRLSQIGDGYVDTTWGRLALSGRVEVVLDSSMESQSDAVTEVSLVPVSE